MFSLIKYIFVHLLMFLLIGSANAHFSITDTTTCKDTLINLQAIAGQSAYTWSNGATTSSILVGTKGLYTVTVTMNDASIQVDSFRVNYLEEKVMISEFLSNTNWTEQLSEFVELYNYGTCPVNLQNWRIADEDGQDTIITSNSHVLNANEYAILARTKQNFQNQWFNGEDIYHVLEVRNHSMNNGADELILISNAGDTLWSLAYANDETEGMGTWININDTHYTQYGTKANPGIVRNGIDVTGTIGYEKNNITPDPLARVGEKNDVASPFNGTVMVCDLKRIRNATCFGNNDGQAYVEIYGGVEPYSYSWSNGESTDTARSLSSGWHTIIVTDFNGLTAIDSISIGESLPLQASIRIDSAASPYGASDAGLSAVIHQGTSPYSYLWSTNDSSSSINNLTVGNYTLVVIDSIGCIDSSDINVNMRNVAPVALFGRAIDFDGNGDKLSTNRPWSKFVKNDEKTIAVWIKPAAHGPNSGFGAGIVCDNQHYAGLYMMKYNGKNSIVAYNYDGVPDFANSTNYALNEWVHVAMVHGNGKLKLYINGVLEKSINSANTSNISKWVTIGSNNFNNVDFNGEIDEVKIFNRALSNAEVIEQMDWASGNETGLKLYYPFSRWDGSGNVTDHSPNGVNASIVGNPQLSELNEIYLNIKEKTIQTGDTLTQVYASDINKDSLVYYLHSGNMNNAFYIDSTSGHISLADKCAMNVTSDTSIQLVFGVKDPAGLFDTSSIYLDIVAINNSKFNYSKSAYCCGASDPSPTIQGIPGGMFSSSGDLSMDSTTGKINLSASPDGHYVVKYTDPDGCSSSTFNVAISSLELSAEIDANISCVGSSDGVSKAIVSGGIAPFTYQWSNGSSDSIASGLSFGSYQLTVNDANGFDQIASILLEEPMASSLTFDFEDLNQSAFSSSNTNHNLYTNESFFSLNWDLRMTKTGDVFSGDLANGNQSARIRYATNGLSGITMKEDIPFGIDSVSLWYGRYGSDATPPVLRVEFSTDSGASWIKAGTDIITQNVTTLTYWSAAIHQTIPTRIRVRAVSGSGGKRANIDDLRIVAPSLSADILTESQVICNGGNGATLNAIASYGIGNYSYSWSNGSIHLNTMDTNHIVSGLSAGSYTLTLTDRCGSTAIESINVSEPDLITDTLNQSSCFSYHWQQKGVTYRNSGIYVDTLSSIEGCDSLVYLNLIIDSNCQSPTQLRALYIQDTSVTLDWQKVVGALSYKIVLRKAGESNWTKILFKQSNTGRFVVNNLTPNTKYVWSIMARLPNGWTNLAVFDKFKTLSNPCINPVNLLAKPVQYNQAKINWTGDSNVFKYRIRYRIIGNTSWTVKPVSHSRNLHWITGLNAGATYEWQIKSVCAVGSSSSGNNWSSSQFFTTQGNYSSSFLRQKRVVFETNPFEVYPNPSNGLLHLKINSDFNSANKLKIYNAYGKLVFSVLVKESQMQLDLRNLKKGTYFLNFKNEVKQLILTQ